MAKRPEREPANRSKSKSKSKSGKKSASRPNKRPSGRPQNKRRQPERKSTVRNAPRNAQRRPARRPVEDYDRDEEMLAEFSDDTNEFFVDEHRERADRNRRPAPKKKEKKVKERKPMSPTQRKIIRILSYGIIISVVLVVGVVLSLTVLFKTQVYEVTGTTRYSDEEIIDACGISKGENIFLAPKRPAEKRIKDKFAYVEDVDVGFSIPDTITIGITEAVEGYFVKVSDNNYLVISTKGRILDQVSETSGYNLPIFIGPKLQSGEIGDYVSYEDDTIVSLITEITQTFADNGYQGITEIDATNPADISFTFEDRIKVKLGIPEDLDYKVRTAMTIITENLDKNQTGTTTGVLDVSRCNSTKRSDFTEEAIKPTETTAATQAPTDTAQQDGGEYAADEYSSGYYDDNAAVYGYDYGYGYDQNYSYDAGLYAADGYGYYYGVE